MKIISGRTKEPYKIAITGVPGIGKSTLATYAPKPIFVDLEGSLARIDCVRNETQIKTWSELDEMLMQLYEMPVSECGTVVIDTVSALQELLIQKILSEVDFKTDTLSDNSVFPYGRGFDRLAAQFSLVFKILDKIKASGKNVILVAHENIETAPNPQGETYERFGIDMHKKAVTTFKKNLDGIFYAHFERSLVAKSKGSDDKVAVASGRRLLLTQDKPWCIAKNRFDLPELVDFSTPELASKFFNMLDGGV